MCQSWLTCCNSQTVQGRQQRRHIVGSFEVECSSKHLGCPGQAGCWSWQVRPSKRSTDCSRPGYHLEADYEVGIVTAIAESYR